MDQQMDNPKCDQNYEVMLNAACEACASAMMVVDENGIIAYVNDEFRRLSGYDVDDVVHRKSWSEFLLLNGTFSMGQVKGNVVNDLSLLQAHGESIFFDRNYRPVIVDAKIRSLPEIKKHIVSIVDVTRLKEGENELLKLKNEVIQLQGMLEKLNEEKTVLEKRLVGDDGFDGITGLPSDDLFMYRLNQAIAYADRQNNKLALIILNLDNFAAINDDYGLTTGNSLLRQVADRLQQCLRQYDTIARVDGDEFAVFADDLNEINDIVKYVEKIRLIFRRPYEIQGRNIYMTTSIGVAVYPHHCSQAESLLDAARMSMRQVKEEGKNGIRYFSSFITPVDERSVLSWEKMQEALSKDEFFPHFQPRYNTVSGRMSGMEAYLRWQPQGEAMVLPDEFLPFLEESGLIVPVGERFLEKVCLQGRAWQEAGMPITRIAVNLSARQFRQNDLTEKIANILGCTGLSPNYLEIDLPEKVVMENVGDSIVKLNELKNIGVTVSIGNVGTGTSSIGELSRLPFDELKIDRSFVGRITSNQEHAVMVSAYLAMGRHLGKKLVAEGVESQDQFDFLSRNYCEEMQGYLFSRPLPISYFNNWCVWSDRWRETTH